jgi:hypothetical protein
MDPVSLLIPLLVFCLICVAIYFFTQMPGVPAFVRPVAYGVAVLFAILWLVGLLGHGSAPHLYR